MRIAIDASRAVALRRTGAENYSLHLIRALLTRAAAPAGRSFDLYFNQPPAPGLLPAGEGVRQRVIPFPRLWTHLRLAAALAADRPDVLFVPAHVLPLTYRGRSVVTVHDLGYVYFPEAHAPRALAYLRWATRHNARHAAHLIADSEATRQDLIRLLGAAPERITVAHLGVDPALAPVTGPERLAAVRARYGLPNEYLLFVGSIQPRKNLARLVDAYGRLWEDGRITAGLALAGGVGWLPDAILERVRRSHAPVALTGYVPDEDMAALYSGAVALAFPSLYEGFGLPALEAMACGTPVLASNSSSLPEVVGDAGVLVDPLNVADIARGLLRLATDAPLRAELRGRGLERARRFTWERTAETVLNVLDRVGRGERVTAGECR